VPVRLRSDAHVTIIVLPAHDDTTYGRLLTLLSSSDSNACDEARPALVFLPTEALLCGGSVGHITGEPHS
jgi:hypothetical protein